MVITFGFHKRRNKRILAFQEEVWSKELVLCEILAFPHTRLDTKNERGKFVYLFMLFWLEETSTKQINMKLAECDVQTPGTWMHEAEGRAYAFRSLWMQIVEHCRGQNNDVHASSKKVATTQTIANWRRMRSYLCEKYFQEGIRYFVEFMSTEPRKIYLCAQ